MKRSWWRRVFVPAALVLGLAGAAKEASAIGPRWVARNYAWHHDYYDPQWTPQPHALVVPPTARRHVEYQWDVTGTEQYRIGHQFRRGTGAFGGGGGPFFPQPVEPSSTQQFGVYYIRAPW